MIDSKRIRRGFWRLQSFAALPKQEQDAILRVALERAVADAERKVAENRRCDWAGYDGSGNWIDRI